MSVAQNQCRRLTFEQLVKLYWRKRRSQEEASGILRAALQAKHTSTPSPDDASEEVATFLMAVGDEITKRERNSELREEALKYLARHVGERSFYIKASPQIVQKIRDFYVSPKHTPSSGRDREHVHAFLRVTTGKTDRTTLMQLSIIVGDYAWLVENKLYEAIPILYGRLFAMLRERGGEDFKRLADVHGICFAGATITAFPDALQQVHFQMDKALQQTTFFMELVRMNTLCGLAFNHYNDEQLRECARTLLELVSRSATVNGDHYDQDH